MPARLGPPRVLGPYHLKDRGSWRIILREPKPRGGSQDTPQDFPSEARALAVKAQLEADLAIYGQAPATWGEAVTAFVDHLRDEGRRPTTLRDRETKLGRVEEAFPGSHPFELSLGQARLYRRSLEAEGLSPTTIKGYMDAVAMLQRWAVSRGWADSAPWANAPKPSPEVRSLYFTEEELGRWLRAAEAMAVDPNRDSDEPGGRRLSDWSQWPAAAWLLTLGCRTRELIHLTGRSVRRARTTGPDGSAVEVVRITIAESKTAAGRRTILMAAPRGCELLLELAATRASDERLFQSRRGALPDRTNWFRRRVQATCEAAGVPVVSTHDIRSTVATLNAEADVDMYGLAALLGHHDPKTTIRNYVHLSSGRAASAALVAAMVTERAYRGAPVLELVK